MTTRILQTMTTNLRKSYWQSMASASMRPCGLQWDPHVLIHGFPRILVGKIRQETVIPCTSIWIVNENWHYPNTLWLLTTLKCPPSSIELPNPTNLWTTEQPTTGTWGDTKFFGCGFAASYIHKTENIYTFSPHKLFKQFFTTYEQDFSSYYSDSVLPEQSPNSRRLLKLTILELPPVIAWPICEYTRQIKVSNIKLVNKTVLG
jgi:hypothetical protein